MGTDFRDTNLYRAAFLRASLKNADFSKTCLSCAILLSEANHNKANLSGSDLGGAKITKIIFEGANLEGIKFDVSKHPREGKNIKLRITRKIKDDSAV